MIAAVAEITLQKMRLSDIPQVFTMEERCFPDPWQPLWFREAIQEGGVCSLFMVEGELAGYMIAIPLGDMFHLANLAVDEPFRRQGVARRALHDLYRQARRYGLKGITLEVRRSNQAAINLYLSEGFVSIGVEPDYYRGEEDALIFRKLLV